jgi:choline transport protein
MGDKAPAKDVWFEFSDYSGWGSYGVATLVGSLGASGALLGSDSAAHLAEELKEASWVLPRSMIATAAVNYSLTFLMTVSKCNPASVFETSRLTAASVHDRQRR